MIKIQEISISGYKNIESAKLRLNNFNVIVGPNNSGKSNFMQSISFLNYIINSSLDDVERNFKEGFASTSFREIVPHIKTSNNLKNNKDSNTGLIQFELIISNSETDRLFKYSIEIEWFSKSFRNSHKIIKEKFEVKESSKPGKYISIFNRKGNEVNYGSKLPRMGAITNVPDHFSVIRVFKIIPNIVDHYSDALNSLDEILKTPIFYFSHIELLKTEKERINSFHGRIVSFELIQEIISLMESDKKNIFLQALKNILQIDDVFVYTSPKHDSKENLPINKNLYLIHDNILKTLSQFSDGTTLIIALITKLLNNTSPLFLIEEPENSIHPQALIDLISFVRSFSEEYQIIITSHSVPLINKTHIDDIIAISANKDGACIFYNISNNKELKTRLKNSHIGFSDELFFAVEDQNEFE